MNKDRPFRCYFCNKVINNDSETAHLTQCGFVLEPCSNKCGSYVPRNSKEKHLKICDNKVNRRSWTVSDYYDTYRSTDSVGKLEASRQNTIPHSNQIPQENINQLSHRLNSFINKFSDYTEIQNNIVRLKSQLDKILHDLPELVLWQNNTHYKLEELHKELKSYEILKRDNEVTIHNVQEIIKEISKLTITFNAQQSEILKENQQGVNFRKEIYTRLQAIEARLSENIPVKVDLNEITKKFEQLEVKNKDVQHFLNEAKENCKSLSLDVRTLSELSAECLEKIKLQDKQIFEIKNLVAQNKLDIELAEDNLENIRGLISNKSGYIIWKINDFEQRMEMAKSKDGTFMKGPIFYSHDYGYRIRLIVFLNGLKKWRGRYLLACLQVMKGHYDELLKWPCKIEANVVLKDCENKENPKDYVRYITAKRECANDEAEDPQESSTQYIFIPHDKLLKSNYIVNNSFFLEISVKGEFAKEP